MSAPLVSPALAASAPGIGDLCFLCPEWVQAAGQALSTAAENHKDALAGAGRFVFCLVGHNPPWHSSPYGEEYKSGTKVYTSPEKGPGRVVYGTKLSFWVRFEGAKVTVEEGELPSQDCDWKVQGDHSVLSRLFRVVARGQDPALVQAAYAQLRPQSRWEVDGKRPEHAGLLAVLREAQETLAVRTIPRFVWMSTDWVSCAREIITARASNPKFAADERRQPMLKDMRYIFAEEFSNPPKYASPDGISGGFWVVVESGHVEVGSGPLPKEYGEPDTLSKGQYIPIIAGGRTVVAALSKEEQQLVQKHNESLPRTFGGKPTMSAMSRVRKGSKPMPAALAICMMPLHDELSLRSSGEMPSDFGVEDLGAPAFDRHPDYQGTWLRYDQVDVYGRPLNPSRL